MIGEIIIYVFFTLSAGIAVIVTVTALREYKASKSGGACGDTVIVKGEIFYVVSVFIAVWAALFEVAALAFKDTPAAGIPVGLVFLGAEVANMFLLRNTVNWKLELEEDSLTHTDIFGRKNIYAYAELTRLQWFGGYRYRARGKFVFGVGIVSGGAAYLNKIMESCGEERRLSVAVKKWESDPATVYARALEAERVFRKTATANDKSLVDALIAEVSAEYVADILRAKPEDERILASIAEKIPRFDDKNMQAKLVEASAVQGNVAAVPAIIGAYRLLNDEQVSLYGAKYDKALAAIGDEKYSRDYRELIFDGNGAEIFAELMRALVKRNTPGLKEELTARLEAYLEGEGGCADLAASNMLRALALTEYDETVRALLERVSLRAASPAVCALAEELCFGYKAV